MLHFALVATGVKVVGVSTAPAVFVDMVQRLQALLAAQYEGASKESEAYRRTIAPKRKLTDVANTVVQSSSQDNSTMFVWTMVQDMEVKLGSLFIGITPESLTEAEPWGGLEATDFGARLVRFVRGADDDDRRSEMSLALGSLQLHRYISTTNANVPSAAEWLGQRLPEKKEILTVPTMQIEMRTRQFIENGNPILAYDLQNELGVRNSRRQFSIGTDLVLFDWVREVYRLTMHHIAEIQSRHNAPMTTDSQSADESEDGLPKSFSLEPTARSATITSRSGPFERGGRQWRPESIKIVPPVIQQLGNFSPGVGFYNLVVQGHLDQAVAIWVHELVTTPVSKLNDALLSLYTKQLEMDTQRPRDP
jgi:hypothetical protein